MREDPWKPTPMQTHLHSWVSTILTHNTINPPNPTYSQLKQITTHQNKTIS
jgi:TorA maturation chaperone TorD